MQLARLPLDHPLLPCLIAACVYFGFLSTYLRSHDAVSFIGAGAIFADAAVIPAGARAVSSEHGYDGQFYYRLAMSPFSTEQPTLGITLDAPRYRQQRIMYPLLAWLLSFRDPMLAPYSLIIVNALGLCVLGYLGGRLAQLLGAHALFGLLLPLYPGYLFTLILDLTEITEAVFVAGSLILLAERRSWAAAIMLSLAALSKETALLVAVGTGLGLMNKPPLRRSHLMLPALVPFATYAAWQAVLFSWWGTTPLEGGSYIRIPFAGILAGWRTSEALGASEARWLGGVGLLLLFGVVIAWQLVRSSAPHAVKTAWLLSVAMLLIVNGKVWVEDLAFGRAASLYMLLGSVVLLGTAQPVRAVALVIMGGAWWWVAAFRLL